MIAVIDADLIGRKKHRFPNLACMKISGYYKDKGEDVVLKLDYENLESYELVYIAKVFTDTPFPEHISFPEHIQASARIHLGGTGFYFDKAPALPEVIEHHMPDYHLYDGWIEGMVQSAKEKCEKQGLTFNEGNYRKQFKEYTDYSIGFLTRGCFRKCPFCVNQKYEKVYIHSPLSEFYDPTRKKICLLDDNVLGSPHFPVLMYLLNSTKKPFRFKQGLDERLLTEEKAKLIFESRYDGDVIFAFDNLSDYDLIKDKLELIKKYRGNKSVKFYVLVGFESTDYKDIESAFKRIQLLLSYGCLPYIMRYQSKDGAPWKESKYRTFYTALARWCNQANMVKKMTFTEFCVANQKVHKTPGTNCSAMQAMLDFKAEHPEIADEYFNIRFKKLG